MAKMTGFKVFKGTKAAFEASGKATANSNAIVFITGGTEGNKGSCIYTQGVYFSSIAEMIQAINYVKGINVSGQSYNAAAGGGYVSFGAADPTTVAVNASSNGIEIGLTAAFIKKVDDVVALASTINSDYLKASDKQALTELINGVSEDVESLTGDVEDIASEIGQLTTLETTNKQTLVGAINEVKGLADTAQGTANEALTAAGTAKTESVITVNTKSDDSYAQSYEIKQNGVVVGTINIPKDMVVKSGEIVDNPEGQPAGKYIKLILQNQTTPIYINVADLVDVYTVKASAAQVQLAISDTNEISATIVAGSVTSAELADNSVVTSKIANGVITEDKLTNAYKTSIATAISQAAAAAPQATTYTKSEVDELIEGIDVTENLANYYTKTETYSKTEVDAMWEWEEL